MKRNEGDNVIKISNSTSFGYCILLQLNTCYLIQCNHLFLFLNCLAENTSWIGQIWALKLSQISSITYVVLSWNCWPMTSSLASMLTFYPKIVPNTHINPNKLFFPFPLPIWTKFSSRKRKNIYFLILLAIFHFILTTCDFRTKLTEFSSEFENSYLIL